ncbi:MAG: pseudaminic acid synthase [Candidatus Omnitrophica bacterium]|nr:pseudaminic acid synthase [Candidatus Omnitrophota bacterium]
MYLKVADRKIKKSCPVFIVAEASANHGQSFKRAVTLIKEAKKCGADAVKFQAYTPDTMTIDVDNKFFRIRHPKWGGQTLYDLYKKAYTPWKWFKKLKKIADSEGIIFFATSFDKMSVDFLEGIGVPIHKIASFELVDLPLIEYVAKTKKPLILSTGMATVSEIKEALKVAKKAGAKDIVLLKCVSSYPARMEDMNINTIPHMKKLFNCPIGLSDHTLGIGVSIAAASIGAKVIEKHFTLSRKLINPDSFFSIEPHELKNLVENIRDAEKALGGVYYGLTAEEKKSRIFRRSLFTVRDINKGEIFTEENIRIIRPSNGLPPKYLEKITGKKSRRAIKRGTPLSWDLVEFHKEKNKKYYR